jgi:manganese transport protein
VRPLPVLLLLVVTRRRDLRGSLVNRRVTTVLAALCTTIILGLNVLLLYLTFGGTIPGLGG